MVQEEVAEDAAAVEDEEDVDGNGDEAGEAGDVD